MSYLHSLLYTPDLKGSLNDGVEIIATSNVTKSVGNFKYALNYSSLIDKETEIIDNSLVMLLRAMLRMQVKHVALAGFDGYSKRSDNYFNVSRAYGFVKDKAAYLNNYVKDFLAAHPEIQVNFVTRSHYNVEAKASPIAENRTTVRRERI